MRLQELVDTSRQVAATRRRLDKRRLLAALLRRAAPADFEIVVAYLSGRLPQGRIGIGPALLRELGPGAASEPVLDVAGLDAWVDEFATLSGSGVQGLRRARLDALWRAATPDEAAFLQRLLLGELRQGALEGVLVDAIADAAGLPGRDVRRAVMLAGDPAPVAGAALRDGAAGLAAFRLTLFQPLQPMLAQPAADVDAALAGAGARVLEYKLDGARVQIHRDGEQVRVYSRQLRDVSAALPEVVELARGLPAERLIVDGEAIVLRDDGSPQPFQVTMRRFGRRRDDPALRAELPLTVYLFDCLHRDGEDLVDRPLSARLAALEALAPGLSVPRQVTGDPSAARDFLARAFADGHEGIMVKNPDSAYAAGSRGADWLKIKQVNTLDLVVLGAEWGSGRRRGWLSNLHLGARDPAGGFVMLGKTFKGLTDEMLAWQTERLEALATHRDGHLVQVRPELVVEIAVNEIQRSPHYPAGLALRFARVKAYRDDKSASEADTIDTVRELHARQGAR